MSPQELASKLNGREYRSEITSAEIESAKADGLVVVYGASDDLMEFEGAIRDEVGCYDGGTAHLNDVGLLTSECEDSHCPYFERAKNTAVLIDALWDVDGYSWKYKTEIPHATFDIMEDGEPYCQGIVFSLADLAKTYAR